MPTKLMTVFIAMDFLFAGCGGLLLGFSLLSEQSMRNTPSVDNVTQNLLLGQCPLTGTTSFPLSSLQKNPQIVESSIRYYQHDSGATPCHATRHRHIFSPFSRVTD